MSEVRLREIGEADVAAAGALLAEGFPQRPPAYWRAALDKLSRRPAVEGCTRYGYVIDIDGVLEGIILLLSARLDGVVRSDLASWYVRRPHRKHARPLYEKCLESQAAVHINLSPTPAALRTALACGFEQYTAGMLALDAGAAAGRGSATVRPLTPALARELAATDGGVAAAHLGYGCSGLLVEDAAGPFVALYRTKRVKRLVPAARFVGGDPVRLVEAAPALMRALLRRGLVLALMDAPLDYRPPRGHLIVGRQPRYARGVKPPAGDLRETELALFSA